MCVSVPGRVIEVGEGVADVDRGGRRIRCSTLLTPDVRPGDHVLVHASLVIEVIDEVEATTLAALLEGRSTE